MVLRTTSSLGRDRRRTRKAGAREIIILDVEIKKAILGRNETPIEGIEYCGGWRDFENMGISCVCTYDINTHLSRVFLEEDLKELVQYLHGKQTAGFNTKRFDIPLLAAHSVYVGDEAITFGPSSPPSWVHTHYDILEQIWLAQGLDPDKFVPRTHGGWGLDAVCQATLGIAKTGHGALAPVWWQQGKRGKVIDYCLNDVWMEGQLLLHIIKHGWVTNVVGSPPMFNVNPPNVVLNAVHPEDNTPSPCFTDDDELHVAPERSPGGLGIIQ